MTLVVTGMDFEGSYTKGSQAGRGRTWCMRYCPGKLKKGVQVNKYTIQKETLRIQNQTNSFRKKKKVEVKGWNKLGDPYLN